MSAGASEHREGPSLWLVVLAVIVFAAFVLTAASTAIGAPGIGPSVDGAVRPAAAPNLAPSPGLMLSPDEPINPASVLAAASRALPGGSDTPEGQKTGLSTVMNVLLVLTVVTLVPSILLMMTCFLRIVVVLGILKQALGTQQMPPSQVMLGLSLIMTLLVMSPTLDRINSEAIGPYRRGEVANYEDLWNRARQPLRDFMFDQIESTGNFSSLYMVLNYRGIDTSDPSRLTRADVDMTSLIPAFVLSELKVAFLMGFKLYLPFLVVDMVISTLLISMSMMMLPPVLISLPFKLLLFVLVDGWQLVVGSLMNSFATHPVTPPTADAMGVLGAVFGVIT